MIEAIGVIDEVILAKLKGKMVPAKQRYSILSAAICLLLLAVMCIPGGRYIYAAILAFGGFIFLGQFKGTMDKYYRANLEAARANNNEFARYKILFEKQSLTIMTMEGEDPTEMDYRTFVRSAEIDESLVFFNDKNQMVFVSKTETDPETLQKIRGIMDFRMPNLNRRKKGQVI